MTNQEALTLLVARWRSMAEIREGLAQERRDSGEITAAIGYESGAKCYLRCAAELETYMEGKTPPPVGQVWNTAEAKENR